MPKGFSQAPSHFLEGTACELPARKNLLVGCRGEGADRPFRIYLSLGHMPHSSLSLQPLTEHTDGSVRALVGAEVWSGQPRISDSLPSPSSSHFSFSHSTSSCVCPPRKPNNTAPQSSPAMVFHNLFSMVEGPGRPVRLSQQCAGAVLPAPLPSPCSRPCSTAARFSSEMPLCVLSHLSRNWPIVPHCPLG